jgi:hypothetical protein
MVRITPSGYAVISNGTVIVARNVAPCPVSQHITIAPEALDSIDMVTARLDAETAMLYHSSGMVPVTSDDPEPMVPAPIDLSDDEVSHVTVDAADLIGLLPFIGADCHAVLTGIGVQRDDNDTGRVWFCATDGKQLGAFYAPAGRVINPAVVPAPVIRALKATKHKGPVTVAWRPSFVDVIASPWHIRSRLIDGIYPAWQALIPRPDAITHVLGPATSMASMAKLVLKGAPRANPGVVVFGADGACRFHDVAGQAYVAAPGGVSVPGACVAYNGRYLANIAAWIGTAPLGYTEAGKGAAAESGNRFALIMPVHLGDKFPGDTVGVPAGAPAPAKPARKRQR